MVGSTVDFLVIGLGSVAVALLGLAVVRRRVPCDALIPHTGATSAVYAVIGVVYGVILGQVVVATWGRFEDAQAAATAEANALLNLVRLADGFPQPERDAVQRAALAYGRAVVDEEWPAMARQQAPSPVAEARIADLFRTYAAAGRGPAGAAPAFGPSLSSLSALDDARGERLQQSSRRLPDLLWVLLVASGALMVVFVYLFGVASRTIHALLVGSVTLVIVLLLLLVERLDTPFQEPVRIPPDAFSGVLRVAEREMAAPSEPAPPPAASPASS